MKKYQTFKIHTAIYIIGQKLKTNIGLGAIAVFNRRKCKIMKDRDNELSMYECILKDA